MMNRKLNLGGWERRWGLLFVAPWIVGFLLLYLAPMLASLGFSFTDFNPANPDKMRFVGLENWSRALSQDKEVLSSVGKTLAFIPICLSINFVFALALAIVLNSRLLLGKSLFRTLFYLPTMIPVVASALMWVGALNAQTGWINVILSAITGLPLSGQSGLRWTDSPSLIYFTYSFISLWGVGNTFVVFLAGLQGVPTELYEAAEVDGASWWRQLFRITLPMITPVLFFNLIIGVLGLLQYFTVPYVITNGGTGYPGGMSNFTMVYFFRQSFSYFNMGYGSVLAWIIFLLGLLFTALLFSTQKKWVYYAGGGK
jgi:multiple sugar transport system permease protein